MDEPTQQQWNIAETEALNISGLTTEKVTTDLYDTMYYDGTKFLVYQSVKQGIINAFTKY
jgi:hypothetical protein